MVSVRDTGAVRWCYRPYWFVLTRRPSVCVPQVELGAAPLPPSQPALPPRADIALPASVRSGMYFVFASVQPSLEEVAWSPCLPSPLLFIAFCFVHTHACNLLTRTLRPHWRMQSDRHNSVRTINRSDPTLIDGCISGDIDRSTSPRAGHLCVVVSGHERRIYTTCTILEKPAITCDRCDAPSSERRWKGCVPTR